jgi:hypothetical protein
VAEYLAPGVYVESKSAPRAIEGVDTNSALMVGVTVRGPDEPVPITSFGEFKQTFGEALAELAPALRDRWALDLENGGDWWHFALSVKGFFENGGRRAVIKRVSCDIPENLAPEDFVKAIQSLNEETDDGCAWCPACGHEKFKQRLSSTAKRGATVSSSSILQMGSTSREFAALAHFAALLLPRSIIPGLRLPISMDARLRLRPLAISLESTRELIRVVAYMRRRLTK